MFVLAKALAPRSGQVPAPAIGKLPGHRPSAYPGHRPVAIHSQPLPVDGPPARHFIFQWADQDRQDSQNPQDMASRACAPGCRLDRRHWDNGRLARCVDCPWIVNGTRKMRVLPVSLFLALHTSMALSWGSWESCSSWPRRWSREAARRLPRPPASCLSFPAASSWRAARKECRFQLAGRPQGISLASGRARTPGTPRTPRTGQMLGAKRCQ